MKILLLFSIARGDKKKFIFIQRSSFSLKYLCTGMKCFYKRQYNGYSECRKAGRPSACQHYLRGEYPTHCTDFFGSRPFSLSCFYFISFLYFLFPISHSVIQWSCLLALFSCGRQVSLTLIHSSPVIYFNALKNTQERAHLSLITALVKIFLFNFLLDFIYLQFWSNRF